MLCGALSVQAADYPDAAQTLMDKLKVAAPQLPVIEVYATPVAGIFAIDLEGGQTLYGTQDGKHLFSGDLYSVGDGIYNLAEERRAVKRKKLLDGVPREEMVVFSPAGETKDYVSVFTDVDCGYCRKLHQEMADINALGIEVRYLAYPRAGIGTPTYGKIVSAWCAKSPAEAITALKAGLTIPSAECDNPVAKQYELGQQVGVTGTPAIVTSDGRLLPGYMPAKRLAEAVGLE
jgi:thiol:disulfide interchange protein DsbC